MEIDIDKLAIIVLIMALGFTWLVVRKVIKLSLEDKVALMAEMNNVSETARITSRDLEMKMTHAKMAHIEAMRKIIIERDLYKSKYETLLKDIEDSKNKAS